MQVQEPEHWARQPGDQLGTGIHEEHCVDVSHRAPRWFCGRPVIVEARTYERFVAWSSEASRRLHVHLNDEHRLERLLQSSGCVAVSSGGCFICRAVDSQGYGADEERQILTMSNVGQAAAPRWLIHE
jgi:hypothetical protein